MGLFGNRIFDVIREMRGLKKQPLTEYVAPSANVYQVPDYYYQQLNQIAPQQQGQYSTPSMLSGLGDLNSLNSLTSLGNYMSQGQAPAPQSNGLQAAPNNPLGFDLQAALQAAAINRPVTQSSFTPVRMYSKPVDAAAPAYYDNGGGDAGGGDGGGDGDGGDGGGDGGDGGGGDGGGGDGGSGERAGGLIDKQHKAAQAYKRGEITFKELCRILKE